MNVLSNKLYTAFALSLTLYPMSCSADFAPCKAIFCHSSSCNMRSNKPDFLH